MLKTINKLMIFVILLSFVMQSTDIGSMLLSVKSNRDTLKTMMTAVPGNKVTAELSAEMLKIPAQAKASSAGLDITSELPVLVGVHNVFESNKYDARYSINTAIHHGARFVIVGDRIQKRNNGWTNSAINKQIKELF